jgi:hypothetical protein
MNQSSRDRITAASQNFIAKFQEKEKELEAKFGPDFAEEGRRFIINKAEAETINKWYASLVPEIVAIQKKQREASGISDTIVPDDEPYYGAIGGGLSYAFTPTGLGNILVVTESTTKKTLNVNDALDWHFFG